MSKIATKILRLLAGFVVSLAVLLVFDLVPWKSDAARFSPGELYFVLSMTAAFCLFVATLAGAIVARSSFVGPAVLLAVGVWYLAVSFLEAVSRALDPGDLVPYLVANVGGVTLTIGGAVIGALVGRRFYTPNEDNASNAT